MSDLTKRILEIGKPLFRFLAPLVGWTNNDMKAGVFDIDIENALASMSPHDFAAVKPKSILTEHIQCYMFNTVIKGLTLNAAKMLLLWHRTIDLEYRGMILRTV